MTPGHEIATAALVVILLAVLAGFVWYWRTSR